MDHAVRLASMRRAVTVERAAPHPLSQITRSSVYYRSFASIHDRQV